MSTSSPLAGKKAFVTGGARGIGAATAVALGAAGVLVTIAGRNESALIETAARHGLAHVVMDVTDETAVARAFRVVGPIDILVNNAGGTSTSPFAKITRAAWDAVIAVNLTGAFLCCRAVLPGMLERGSGRIVNIASTGGLVPYRYVAAYIAAKHGLIGLTRALGLETATKGITVNAVCPGYTDTDMVRDALTVVAARTGRSEADALAAMLKNNPQGRLVQPQEVADMVLWLCQPTTAGITGQSMVIAGGEVMH